MSNLTPTNLKDDNGNVVYPYTYSDFVIGDDGQPINRVLGNITTNSNLCEAYDTTKTYPTYSKYCIHGNTLYVYSGAEGTTTTGAFDDTKWTATNLIQTMDDFSQDVPHLGTSIAGDVDPTDPYLNQSDIVNNLTSDSAIDPLSAAMGKNLQTQITQLNSTLAKTVVTDLFTNRHSAIDLLRVTKQGAVVYVELRLLISPTVPLNNGALLCNVDSSLLPSNWVLESVKDGNGQFVDGSVWIENYQNRCLYTGVNLTVSSGTKKYYATFTYITH